MVLQILSAAGFVFVCTLLLSVKASSPPASCDLVVDVNEPFSRHFTEDGVQMCFRCVVNGMTSPSASWLVQSSTENGNRLEVIDPAHGEVVNGVLVLYNPTSLVRPGNSNAIEAQCSAFSMQYTVFFISRVFVPPTVENVTVTEGEVLRISCTDDNPSGLGVTQSWQGENRRVVSVDAKYTVRESARRSDNDLIYCCVLTNAENRTLKATVTITVQYTPRVWSADPSYNEVLLNEDLILSCTSDGLPQPGVQWLHNDTVLGNGERSSINTNDTYSQLNLMNVVLEGAGTYVCNVSNSVGHNVTEFEVRVQIPPFLPTDVTSIRGETTIILSWRNGFDGYSPITEAKIEIRNSERGLLETRIFSGSSIQSAELTGLEPLKDYVFVLRVLNRAGSSEPVSINASTLSLRLAAPEVTNNVDVVSSSSLYLEWESLEPLPETTDPVNSWMVEISPLNSDMGSTENFTISEPNTTNFTFTNLLKGTQYHMRVAGLNTRGLGFFSEYVILETISEPPSSGPEGFSAKPNQRSIEFSWQPPPTGDRNGDITSYTLSCQVSDTDLDGVLPGLTVVYENEGTYVVGGFRPFTNYNCSVFASNKAGDGAVSSLSLTTLNDSALFQLRLTHINCLQWVSHDGQARVDSIIHEVGSYLQKRCQCDFASDRLKDGIWRCFEESPQAVTFRATLHGTINHSSTDLLRVIETWTAQNATLIIGAVLLTVDNTCAVRISSIHERECVPRNTTESELGFDVREVMIGIGTGLSVAIAIEIGIIVCLIIGMLVIHVWKISNTTIDTMVKLVTHGSSETDGPRPKPRCQGPGIPLSNIGSESIAVLDDDKDSGVINTSGESGDAIDAGEGGESGEAIDAGEGGESGESGESGEGQQPCTCENGKIHQPPVCEGGDPGEGQPVTIEGGGEGGDTGEGIGSASHEDSDETDGEGGEGGGDHHDGAEGAAVANTALNTNGTEDLHAKMAGAMNESRVIERIVIPTENA